MSAKIYNGFVLPKMNLKQLHQLVLRMRERAACIYSELYHEKLASLCCGILDNFMFQPEDVFLKGIKREYEHFDLNDHPLLIATWIIWKRHRKIEQTMKRDPDFDFNCEIVLIPGKRKIYMLFYAENKAYWEMLETFPEVQEYLYWDNTDPPDGFTWSRWKRRGAEWDRILSVHKSGVPSLCGFTANLVTNGYITPEIPQVLALMPTLEQRVKYLAWHKVFRQVIKEFNAEAEVESAESVGLYFKAREYLSTDQGKALLKGEEQRLAGILQPVFTKEDLLKPLKDRKPVVLAEAKS